LWITGLPEGKTLAGLSDIQKRAGQIGVSLFIWVVAPPSTLQSPAVDTLAALAAQTGGQTFGFSGDETLPHIGDYFTRLRGVYALKYTSRAAQAGGQTLSVRIKSGDQTFESAPLTYQIDVQPPNPIFVSAPESITRISPPLSADPLKPLAPKTLTLQTLIDFPDGHSRPLAWLRLYVDGKQVSELSSPPFDHFTWDLSPYTTSGAHTLQLEAQDSLGLTQRSLALPVQVVVSVPSASLGSFWAAYRRQFATAGHVLLLAALAAGGFFGWRRYQRARAHRPEAASPHVQDKPSAEPAAAQNAAPDTGRRTRPLKARLIYIDSDGLATSIPPIQVTPRGMTFGSDPAQATCLLDDPSVDALHARLRFTPDGGYLLIDAGSIAGTWVNYQPVPLAGALLQHGDIIHMGRTALRFLLANPSDLPRVRVEPLSEQP
jgi:hypothetical protein